MKEREVADRENTQWKCVQAFSGLAGKAAGEAEQKVTNEQGKVPVVCTPSGGAQSVRLELPLGWEDQLSEKELLSAINAARK